MIPGHVKSIVLPQEETGIVGFKPGSIPETLVVKDEFPVGLQLGAGAVRG